MTGSFPKLPFYAWLAASALAGCVVGGSDGTTSELALGEDAEGESEGEDTDEGAACPGATGPITAEIGCKLASVQSCKELSNVVLELEDGTTERFEDLSGHSGVFAGTGDNEGKRIVRIWVKAGANLSGEGPGYGEPFFACPLEQCTDSALDAPSEEEPAPEPGEEPF